MGWLVPPPPPASLPASSSAATCAWPCFAASDAAVAPRLSTAPASAPRASSSRTTPSCPRAAAPCSSRRLSKMPPT
eukprot:scaffold30359_cov59-Phaeocystis_antarctica.AAC.6